MHWASVPRPRLLTLFREDMPFTFVYGLAGCGKTQLVREWARTQKSTPIWVACTEADNDPCIFWQHLMQALAPTTTHASLTASPFPSNVEAAVVALTRWIEAQQQLLQLVLDDYHLIQAKETRWILPYFL